jgi:hypothetical protein
MFEASIELRSDVDPEELKKLSVKKLVLGMNRAADILGGSLREFSLSTVLHGRTGTLAREWVLERDPGEVLAWRFRNRMAYAAVQEYGGTITPKNASMLTIPLPGPALTERGVPRFKSARDVPGLFVFKSASGQAFLAQHTGKGPGGIALWYILRKSVSSAIESGSKRPRN